MLPTRHSLAFKCIHRLKSEGMEKEIHASGNQTKVGRAILPSNEIRLHAKYGNHTQIRSLDNNKVVNSSRTYNNCKGGAPIGSRYWQIWRNRPQHDNSTGLQYPTFSNGQIDHPESKSTRKCRTWTIHYTMQTEQSYTEHSIQQQWNTRSSQLHKEHPPG